MNPIHDEIKLFADLRNNIVHKNGNLKDANEQRKIGLKENNKKIEIFENRLFIKANELIFDYLK